MIPFIWKINSALVLVVVEQRIKLLLDMVGLKWLCAS